MASTEDAGAAGDVDDDASAEVEANRCRRACVLSGWTTAAARLAVNDMLLGGVAV